MSYDKFVLMSRYTGEEFVPDSQPLICFQTKGMSLSGSPRTNRHVSVVSNSGVETYNYNDQMRGHVCLLINSGSAEPCHKQNLFFSLFCRGSGLAGLRTVAVRLVGNRRKKSTRKKIKVVGDNYKNNFMELCHKMSFPVRRVWFSVSACLRARKNSAGILKLHDDVQTCEYRDVQVMWEMLRKSETELIANQPKRKQRPFWRVFVWSNHNKASSFSA